MSDIGSSITYRYTAAVTSDSTKPSTAEAWCRVSGFGLLIQQFSMFSFAIAGLVKLGRRVRLVRHVGFSVVRVGA